MDNDDTTQQPAQPDQPARQRLRDRAFGFRSVLAVTAAGVVLGAAAGAGVSALADGPDRHRHPGMMQQRFGERGGPGERGGFGERGELRERGGMPGGPRGQGTPGQLVPPSGSDDQDAPSEPEESPNS